MQKNGRDAKQLAKDLESKESETMCCSSTILLFLE